MVAPVALSLRKVSKRTQSLKAISKLRMRRRRLKQKKRLSNKLKSYGRRLSDLSAL